MTRGRQRQTREALRWSEHGDTCWRQYRNTGDLEALNYCVLASRLAVAAVPDTHDLAVGLRQNLVRVLTELHTATRDPEPLDEALSAVTELMERDAEDADTHEVAVVLLAQAEEHDGGPLAHHATARRTFVAAYADVSLRAGRSLVAAALDSHDIDVLEQGIRIISRALEAPTDDPAVVSERMHARALGSAVRWQLIGEPADLDAAIDGFLAAMSLVDPAPMLLHHNLALAYMQRYERDGDTEDLASAVAAFAAAAPEGDAASTREWQMHMVGLLWSRYEATADLDDLDTAIGLARELTTGIPAADLSREQVEQVLCTLRNLLEARQVYRPDVEVTHEITELSGILGDDERDSGHLPRLLPWTRTYD